MMTRDALQATLARMEDALAETRRNIAGVERRMRNHAETETIRLRPKARDYHRRMSRWTGADEAQYQRILEALGWRHLRRAGAARRQGRATGPRHRGAAPEIRRQRRKAAIHCGVTCRLALGRSAFRQFEEKHLLLDHRASDLVVHEGFRVREYQPQTTLQRDLIGYDVEHSVPIM